jgi:hypothetical protein
MASKTEELEMEIYQQIRGLDKRQQTIIYENIRKIKFNMIQYGKLLATGKEEFSRRRR